MKITLYILAFAAVALTAYDIGTLDIMLDNSRPPLANYTEKQCADIIQEKDGRIICEIDMNTPHDNIRIFTR